MPQFSHTVLIIKTSSHLKQPPVSLARREFVGNDHGQLVRISSTAKGSLRSRHATSSQSCTVISRTFGNRRCGT